MTDIETYRKALDIALTDLTVTLTEARDYLYNPDYPPRRHRHADQFRGQSRRRESSTAPLHQRDAEESMTRLFTQMLDGVTGGDCIDVMAHMPAQQHRLRADRSAVSRPLP